MADAEHLKLDDGTVIDIADAVARQKIGSAELQTTAKDCSGAINELKQSLDGLAKNHIIQFSDSSPKVLSLPPYYRGVLITTDSTSSNCGIFVLYTTYSGTSASYNALVNASNVNISASGANMTLSTNSGGCFAILIDINNNVAI